MAGAWLGHNGRSEGQPAWLDNRVVSRFAPAPSPADRTSRRVLGGLCEKRPRKLYLRVPPHFYDYEMRETSGRKAIHHRIARSPIWIPERLCRTDPAGQ